MRYRSLNNFLIEAEEIEFGKNVEFGVDGNIKCRGKFKVGDNSYIGDRFTANCENLTIGEYFYNKPTDSRGMVIGGGGSNFPYANLTIGDRVVCHTGHINLAREVTIGNDVGLSHDVDILTHGFWGSILEGFPATFKSVVIGNNVILGWKATVLPGVEICPQTVIGSNSVVTKSITESGIYGGNPCKFIKEIVTPEFEEKLRKISNIINEWNKLMEFYEIEDYRASYLFPRVKIRYLIIDVEDLNCYGEHDEVTDAFRDFLRRYGIRIFHPRGFKFNLERI